MKSPATIAIGPIPDRVGDLGLEGAVAVAQQHRHVVGRRSWRRPGRVRPSPVKSPATMASGCDPDRVGDLGLERAVAVAQQHRHVSSELQSLATARSSPAVAGEVARHDGDRVDPRPRR